jgi:3-(methylthio)propanoyl-CoA dehydrogenase
VTDYTAPLADMRFALSEFAGLPALAGFPAFEAATPDLVDAVLEEAAKLAADVLAPLNRVGDQHGSRLENGVVLTPPGFKDAYAEYVSGGWNAIAGPAEYGGQGLPVSLAAAVTEMWTSANMGFSLCPMLTQGAIEALLSHGSEEQRRLYLAKLVSGEWTGTMNLTEPQAGSDVGALRTRAIRDGDRYRITGQKIFITYGEHDLAENIIHLVLARLPDAPAGSRGISLFAVPKVLVRPDGSLGQRNDVRCVSLEHKLGIHASPTCVLAFGEDGGAIGTLVGAENRGLECMFTMMNAARFNVGLEGVAIAERALQQARAYAQQRIQGRPVTAETSEPLPIVHHPDVRRMILGMRADTEAMRALAYYVAGATDRARHHPDPARRRAEQLRVDLLIPVVKAWCTDGGVRIASTGVQVHGGMGYIEETGAAQHLRDSRIAPIYEGTNGIQANDLVHRKLMRDGGAAARALIAEMRGLDAGLAAQPRTDLAVIRRTLSAGVDALEAATRALLESGSDVGAALAGSAPYLDLMGIVAGGWLMAKGALAVAAGHGDAHFAAAKLTTARFYAEQRLAAAPGLLASVMGGATVMRLDPELL